MATRSAVLGLTAQGVSTSEGRFGEAFFGVFGTEEKLGREGLGGLANGLGMRVAGYASLGDLLHDLEGPAILEGFRALGERGLSAARDIEGGLNASREIRYLLYPTGRRSQAQVPVGIFESLFLADS